MRAAALLEACRDEFHLGPAYVVLHDGVGIHISLLVRKGHDVQHLLDEIRHEGLVLLHADTGKQVNAVPHAAGIEAQRIICRHQGDVRIKALKTAELDEILPEALVVSVCLHDETCPLQIRQAQVLPAREGRCLVNADHELPVEFRNQHGAQAVWDLELRCGVHRDRCLEGDVDLPLLHHLKRIHSAAVHVYVVHAKAAELALCLRYGLVDSVIQVIRMQHVRNGDSAAVRGGQLLQVVHHVCLVTDDLARVLEDHLSRSRQAQGPGVIEELAAELVLQGAHVPA